MIRGLLTAGDRVLILVYLLAIATSGVLAGRLSAGGEAALVIVGEKAVLRLDLLESRTLTVHGDPGDVKVQVEEGAIRVVSAQCPNRVCVRTGRILRAGEVILCAPNRVFIRIVGRGKGGVRAVTG
jgi:hypothetical protein